MTNSIGSFALLYILGAVSKMVCDRLEGLSKVKSYL